MYFPLNIKNRMVQGHLQDFGTLSSYMHQFSDDQFLLAMSDLHVLLYIATMDMLPLKVSYIQSV